MPVTGFFSIHSCPTWHARATYATFFSDFEIPGVHLSRRDHARTDPRSPRSRFGTNGELQMVRFYDSDDDDAGRRDYSWSLSLRSRRRLYIFDRRDQLLSGPRTKARPPGQINERATARPRVISRRRLQDDRHPRPESSSHILHAVRRFARMGK